MVARVVVPSELTLTVKFPLLIMLLCSRERARGAVE